jgi:hypothetical protein
MWISGKNPVRVLNNQENHLLAKALEALTDLSNLINPHFSQNINTVVRAPKKAGNP